MDVAVEAAPHGAQQRRRHGHAAHGARGKVDVVVPVDDGLAPRHLVGDVAKGRQPVHHLVQDAAERPDIARLAQLHKLGPAGQPSATRVVGVHERLGRHVVGRANLRLSVDVDRLVRLDGVGDTKVDELQPATDQHKVGGLQI